MSNAIGVDGGCGIERQLKEIRERSKLLGVPER
jgi:hypothetical protein